MLVTVPAMPYEWPVARDCLDATHPLPELGDAPTADQQAAYDAALARRNAAEDLAVHVLWALSGRQYGIKPVTVRPCVRNGIEQFMQGPFATGTDLYLWADGGWLRGWCGCLATCRRRGPRMTHLPGPVFEVTRVTVDGVVLAADTYRLEGDVLYRIGAAWPGQDLGKPLGEPGTWSVEYGQGIQPPDGVATFVGLLAREFLAACDDTSCRLPRNVVATSRQGVSKTFDPSRMLAAGKTGLAEIDLWLASVNPHRLLAAPEVL